MKDYYSSLHKFLSTNFPAQLPKLEAIKDNDVEVIKMYNMYKRSAKNALKERVDEAEYYGVDRDTEMRAAGIGGSTNYMPWKNATGFIATVKRYVKPADIQSLSTSIVTTKPGSKTFMTFIAKDGFDMGQVVETITPGLERMSKAEGLHFLIQEIDANSFSLSAKRSYDTFTDDFGKELNIDKSSEYYIGESVNEMDMNDPILMKMRAAKMKADKFAGSDPKAGSTIKGRGFDWDKNTIEIDKLKKKRAQIMSDMEQEAEPEGGPIADEYGSKLNRIDAAIAKLSGRKEMTYDQAINEELNLSNYGKVTPPKGGASLVGKYNSIQGKSKYDTVIFDYQEGSDKPYGIVQVEGHGIYGSDLLKRLGLRQTRSWTAGVDVYIHDGNNTPVYVSEDDFKTLLDFWSGGLDREAKAQADFYRGRGNTSGTIDENKMLKQAKLSSAEYQKAKKLKDFNKDDYEWNSVEGLYVKEKKSKFKKHGEMSGFDMRGINEQMDIYDEIANEEFGMDYDQLGSNEKEWVRDEIDNMSMNEAKATCCHRCGRVHVKGTPCKRPYLKGKDSCAVKEVQDLQERLDNLKETKSAPEGHYFTKSGNLVKGRMTKDAEERGARKSDPKDKMRSKIPKVTQYTEIVKEYIKSNPKMNKSKMMEAIRSIISEHETDPALELMVGDYQTKHYHMCPGAKALYQDIESKGVDMDLAVRTAKLQDALFAMEEEALDNGATEVDLFAAETVASQIMDMARMMGLEEEHSYIQGHITKIKNALVK